MAREIKWGRLTQTETETLTALVKSGTEVFAAPVEIEKDPELRKMQFECLGITWADCKTWHIGSEKVIVHLTPADKATHDMLLGELRDKHRDEYRKRRCLIPGVLKPLIPCPESNRCAECPFPECRDKHRANNLSWEQIIEKAYEGNDADAHEEPGYHQTEVRMELEAVCKVIDARNPLYAKAIIMKEYHGMSVEEIAKELHTTKRRVYFYLDEAKKIGKQYKEENYK